MTPNDILEYELEAHLADLKKNFAVCVAGRIVQNAFSICADKYPDCWLLLRDMEECGECQ